MNPWFRACVLCALAAALTGPARAEDDPMLKRLQALEKSFQRFRAERDAYQAQLKEKEKALADAQALVRDADARIKAAEKRAADAEGERAELERQLKSALDNLAAAKTAGADNARQARELSAARDEAARKAEEQMAQVQKEKKTLETRVAEMERSLSDQQGRKEALEKQIRSLESSLSTDKPAPADTGRVAELEKQVADLQARLRDRGEGAVAPVSTSVSPAADVQSGTVPPPPAPAPATLSPRSVALQKARSLRDANRTEDAVAVYRAWIKNNTSDTESVMELASLLQQANRLDEARKTLDGLNRRAPPSPDLWLLRGRIEQDAGHMDAARDAFDKALKMNADFIPALKEMAILSQAQGRTADAVQMLQRARKANPDDGEVLFNLSALMLMSDPPNVREAEQLYRRSLLLGEERDEQIERRLSNSK